jgi:hypothetical protein
MIANATACCRPAPTNFQETLSLREMSVQQSQTVNLSFTDEAGRTYALTVDKNTSLYAATYDRQAQLAAPGRRGHGVAHGHHHGRRVEDGKRPERTFRQMDLTVTGFQKLLHRSLKAADRKYADHYRHSDPVETRAHAVEAEHAEFLAVNQTVTITLRAPADMPADYWSVENTAGRLRDFAVGLFAGGDRADHAEKMIAAMEQGYEDARTAFGGALPDVSRQTVDLAKELLTQWANQADENAADQVPALDLVA